MQAPVVELTELDNCVLGVVWREGPLSTYGVRSHFAESTTVGWSSSSGSIYPSIRRLIAAGLVKAGEASDRRGTQELRITAAGVAQLGEWVSSLRPSLASAMPDPLRTRAQFLTCLEPDRRQRFLADSRLHTQAALAELQACADRPALTEAERLERIGDIGAILELRARLQWLNFLADWLVREGAE